MDRDALEVAIRVALDAALSLIAAFVAVLIAGLFIDDPATKIVLAALVWLLTFGGFLWARFLKESH